MHTLIIFQLFLAVATQEPPSVGMEFEQFKLSIVSACDEVLNAVEMSEESAYLASLMKIRELQPLMDSAIVAYPGADIKWIRDALLERSNELLQSYWDYPYLREPYVGWQDTKLDYIAPIITLFNIIKAQVKKLQLHSITADDSTKAGP